MKRQTVMIVDDNPTNIELLSESIGDDYELVFATSAAEALELIRVDKPDLLLLDVMMPGMDGYQLCTVLKNDPATRDIPIIFVTAMCQEQDEIRGLELGAIDYVTKPISPHIVRARVRNHLELKRYRDLLESLSQAADRAKKEFLRSISHELRTPLTPILGMTDLVLTSEEDDDKRKYLSLVQKAALRLLGIIEDLIETSRLQGDSASVEMAPFSVRPFLEGVLGELEPVAADKGLALEYQVAAGVPEAVGSDQSLLRRLLTIMLGNALKFTQNGSVRLELERQERPAAPRLLFSVLDTGVGLSAEDLDRIFDDFTQSDGSVTRPFQGLGLGLGLARRIAELMGGRIWAEVRPGGGSIFRCEIPFHPVPPRHVEGAP